MQGLDLLETMRADQGCQSLRLHDLDDQVEQLMRGDWIYRTGWLVEDQNAGVVEQGTGQLQSRPHPCRQGEHGGLSRVGETYPRQGRFDPFLEVLTLEALELTVKVEILGTGESHDQTAVFCRHPTDDPTNAHRLAMAVVTHHAGLPSRRGGESDQDPERRRLARPIGPDDGADLTRTDLERDAVECDYVLFDVGPDEKFHPPR